MSGLKKHASISLALASLFFALPLCAQEMGTKIDRKDEKSFWNKKYGKKMYIFGTKPNVFLAEQIEKLSPGKILFPAEGEGRNAVHAAKQKWEVHAFDVSEVAKEKALKLAEKENVSINYFVDDASSVDLKPNTYDVVAVIFFQPQDNEETSKFFKKLKDSVKPGGKILVEGFAKKHLKLGTKFGPKDESCLYDKQIFKQNFKDWKIALIKEHKTVLDEGMHDGDAIVVDCVAVKPKTK